MSGILNKRLLRYIWALPNTLLGLPFIFLALISGGRIHVVDGVIEIHGGIISFFLRYCVPIPGGAAAMTLGHIVLGRNKSMLSATRRHERVHVRQCEKWGPAFLPVYVVAGLWAFIRSGRAYTENYFEREARQKERVE